MNSSNSNENDDDSCEKQKTPFTYTDAYELISKKILINRLSLENLRYQIKYCQFFRKIQDATEQLANKKIQLVEQLNNIFEQQLKEFTSDNQELCLSIYRQINELDTPTDEFKHKCSILETTRGQMEDLITRIQHIESTIPNEQIVTNYTVKKSNSK